MRKRIDFTSRLETFQGMFKLCLLTIIFLSLNHGQVYGDSTYFPEDAMNEGTDKNSAENSDSVREWAELHPPQQKVTSVEERNEASLGESQVIASEKNVVQKPLPIAAPSSPPPATSPTTPLNKPNSPVSVAPTPIIVPTSSAEQAISFSKEPEPLQTTTVEPRSKAIPVKDQATKQNIAQKTILSYSQVANDRSPLAILENGQEIHNQKWYIYSAAIRGLKNPSDKLQVVSMEGSPPNKGEDIRMLLVGMGIEPEKIQLIHGTGEEHQRGMTYIFAGK